MENPKTRQMYKGELRAVEELQQFQIAQLTEDCNLEFTQAKAGDILLIKSASKEYWAKNIFVIEYLDENMNDRRLFMRTSEKKLNILTGTKARHLSEVFAEYRKATPPARTYPQIGSDPEIFVSGPSGIIPAWMFLGSKEKPNTGESHYYGNNNIYWDGFQAEFDTKPVDCIAYSCDSIYSGLKGVYDAARKFDKKATLSNQAVVEVDKKILASADQKYVQFGCMPSKNAYGMSGSKEDGRETPIRFAGGHIHLGMGGISGREAEIVKAMDSILGVACVSMFADYDKPIRRKYYGLAGEYRTPQYGIEYRTLSNAWLMHPVLANVVLELARISLSYGVHKSENWQAAEDETIQAIQQCDVDLARSILGRNKKLLCRMFNQEYGKNGLLALNPGEIVYQMFMNGVDSFIEEPANIVDNWRLKGGWIFHCKGKEFNFANSFHLLKDGKKI